MIVWSSCEEGMPGPGEYLICHEVYGYQYITVAVVEEDVFLIQDDDSSYEVDCPTHWAELKKPWQK